MEGRKTKGEEGLLVSLKAIDSQIERELLRTPAEREGKGLDRREPQLKRVEILAGFLLEKFGNGEIGLDGIIVSVQAFLKALILLHEESQDGDLGKSRSQNCQQALNDIYNEIQRALGQEKEEVVN